MTLKYFNVKNGLVTGNIILDASTSNVTASTFSGNISVTTSANLGNVGNIKISGGSTGQILSTDGAGNLSWVEQSAGGGAGALVYVDTFTADGIVDTFTLAHTPASVSYTLVNINGTSQLRDSYSLNGANVVFSEIPPAGVVIEVTTIAQGTSSGGGGSSGGTVDTSMILSPFLLMGA